VLEPYLDKGIVSLFHETSVLSGCQRSLYNKHILPHIDETH